MHQFNLLFISKFLFCILSIVKLEDLHCWSLDTHAPTLELFSKHEHCFARVLSHIVAFIPTAWSWKNTPRTTTAMFWYFHNTFSKLSFCFIKFSIYWDPLIDFVRLLSWVATRHKHFVKVLRFHLNQYKVILLQQVSRMIFCIHLEFKY